MKKKILSILIAVFIIMPCLFLTACGGNSSEQFKITYYANGNEFKVDNSSGNETLILPTPE